MFGNLSNPFDIPQFLTVNMDKTIEIFLGELLVEQGLPRDGFVYLRIPQIRMSISRRMFERINSNLDCPFENKATFQELWPDRINSSLRPSHIDTYFNEADKFGGQLVDILFSCTGFYNKHLINCKRLGNRAGPSF